MLDDIAAIQQRISDIQSRIAMLNGSSLTPPPTDSAADPSANRSFDSVLADERARYGMAASPTDQAGAATPEPAPGGPIGMPGSGIPIGRRPYIAEPSAGPLPATPSTRAVTPLVPTTQQLVPIKAGSATDYDPIIDRYAAANGLSPKLVKAVIKTESDGNPRDVSRAGAMGLMQLMPDNVREAGISDPFDPEQNIAAGTKQLADLLKQYHGDLDLALAGYNAGPGNVHKYGGVPPFRETQNYIVKVRRAMGEE